MASVIKIIIKSSLLTRRIFPNRKLNKSSVKPPDMLIRITPIARPDVKSTAIDESGGILVDSLNLFTPTADNIADDVSSQYWIYASEKTKRLFHQMPHAPVHHQTRNVV